METETKFIEVETDDEDVLAGPTCSPQAMQQRVGRAKRRIAEAMRPKPTNNKRILQLKRAAEDAQAAVEIAYSPFEVMRRSCLNTGARKAAEVAVVNAVERAILAQATYAGAVAAFEQSTSAAIRSESVADPVLHLLPNRLESSFDQDWNGNAYTLFVSMLKRFEEKFPMIMRVG